ncbi:MAG: hypothetical protein CMP08_09770 [Xanthomonadales bacterium]|nr:hypothetical protein [Xanthomonadales bacterium]
MKTPDRQRPLDRLSIKTRVAIALIAVMPVAGLAQTSSATQAMANPPDRSDSLDYQQADAAVRKLVALTDVTQLRNVFTDQFIGRVESAMSLLGGSLGPETMNLVTEQTRAVVSERIADGDALYSVLAPIYEKHFNLIELNQLVNFYQSPLGQKLVRISPELLTESLDLGQQWGMSLVPEIVSRVRARMNGASAASLAAEPAPADDAYAAPSPVE